MIFNKQLILERFISLVKIDSPSGYEDNLRNKLLYEFNRLGINGDTDATGNLKFFIPGNDDLPVRLFSAHMDTVEPGRGIQPRIISPDTITSDGKTVLGADDKDGITVIWCALEEIIRHKIPHPPLEILFTVNEENSLRGSKQIIPGWLQAKSGWVCDGPGRPGYIYCNGIGKTGYKIQICGRAAHSGICPDKGLNSMLAAASAILSFPPGKLGPATVNYGTISGGIADNIVPEKTYITGEIRAHHPELLNEIWHNLQSAWQNAAEKHGCSIIVELGDCYPAFKLDSDSKLAKITLKTLETLHLNPEIVNFNAGSDANILNKLGIDVCILAMGRQANHTTEENTTVENLATMTKTISMLMTDMATHEPLFPALAGHPL